MTTNVVAPKAKGQKAKEPLPHDFKSLYKNEFIEEALTIDQVNRLKMGSIRQVSKYSGDLNSKLVPYSNGPKQFAS